MHASCKKFAVAATAVGMFALIVSAACAKGASGHTQAARPKASARQSRAKSTGHFAGAKTQTTKSAATRQAGSRQTTPRQASPGQAGLGGYGSTNTGYGGGTSSNTGSTGNSANGHGRRGLPNFVWTPPDPPAARRGRPQLPEFVWTPPPAPVLRKGPRTIPDFVWTPPNHPGDTQPRPSQLRNWGDPPPTPPAPQGNGSGGPQQIIKDLNYLQNRSPYKP
jgi:hypothetical protein